jgi:hypothetical protein
VADVFSWKRNRSVKENFAVSFQKFKVAPGRIKLLVAAVVLFVGLTITQMTGCVLHLVPHPATSEGIPPIGTLR